MSVARVFSILLLALLSIATLPAAPRTALAAAGEDPGTIAYIRRGPNEIRLIQPDGTNDRLLWASPKPTSVTGITNLEWRPDGEVLAFSSDHEETCSWYESDLYTIRRDGFGLQRITNAPACAQLASYPQGKVTVNLSTFGRSGYFNVYVAGASELKGLLLSGMDSGQVTFDHVADFGPGIAQPAVGIYGLYRYPGATAPDVQAGKTASVPQLWLSATNEFDALGTGKVSWRADSSRIGYAMRNCMAIRQISPNPPVASVGDNLATVSDVSPCLVDWAPITSRANEYLYYVPYNYLVDNVDGIYLASTATAGGGTRVVSPQSFKFPDISSVHDLKWLPDGSGFLFTMTYVYVNMEDPDPVCVGTCTDVFEYDFNAGTVTQVTRLKDDTARDMTISPDGQQIAFTRVTEDPANPLNTTYAIWIVQRDGTGLRLLVDNAMSPAWGKTATVPPLTKLYLPLAVH